MKKYPKTISCDERGQLVIPKDIRTDLGIEDGSGFLVYVLVDEGILLKKIDTLPLDAHTSVLTEIKEKADKLDIKKENITKSVKRYEKNKEGNLEII